MSAADKKLRVARIPSTVDAYRRRDGGNDSPLMDMAGDRPLCAPADSSLSSQDLIMDELETVLFVNNGRHSQQVNYNLDGHATTASSTGQNNNKRVIAQQSPSRHDARGVVDAGNTLHRLFEVDDAKKPASWLDEIRGENLDRTSLFCMSVFLFEFLTHMLYPLSIPVVLCVQGRAAITKGFIPGAGASFFQLVATLIYLVPTIMAVVVAADGNSWAIGPAGVGAAMAMFRLLVIGGKYACFTPEMYASVTHAHVDVTSQLLLLSWFVDIDPATVEAELALAEDATNLRLEESHFVLADGSIWNAREYTKSLTRFSFGTPVFRQFIPWSCRVGSVVLSLYTLWKFLDEAPNRSDAIAITLLVLIMVETVFYTNIVFGFLAVGILHYYRMWLMRTAHVSILGFSRCRTCLSDATIMAGRCGVGAVPTQVASNLTAWVTVSTVIASYAAVFTRRVGFNTLANITVCASLGAILILSVWVNKASDPKLVCVVSYLFLVVSLGVLTTAFLGYQANRCERSVLKFLEEERVALRWRTHFASARTSGSPFGARTSFAEGLTQSVGGIVVPLEQLPPKAASELFDTVDAVVAFLQRRSDTSPLKVMFVAASAELVTLLLSLATSGALVIAGVLLQANPGQ